MVKLRPTFRPSVWQCPLYAQAFNVRHLAMVYALIVHSVLPNPQLLSLGALLQQFQGMTISSNAATNAPGTPSSSSSQFVSKFPFTPSKSLPIGLASPAAASINASASNALAIPGSQLFGAAPTLDTPALSFNGIPLSPAQTGIAGGPPESVTIFNAQWFDNFDGDTSASDPLGQAIATQTAMHFYQYKQLQVGAYSSAVQDEVKRRRNPGALVPPSPASSHLDSVWASPALTMTGDAYPSFDGIYSLPSNDITKKALQVVWRQCDACLFSMVCYEDENTLLALNFLQLLPRLLTEQYRVQQICQNPREFIARPEELLLLLHTYLPHGLLQTIPNSLAKQLKRESDAMS